MGRVSGEWRGWILHSLERVDNSSTSILRRIGEGYSLAFLGESARPRVLVSFRADLAFAVRCLVSCAPPPPELMSPSYQGALQTLP